MIFVRIWIFYYSKVTKEENTSLFKKKNQNNVLVIGGAGYIGSSLVGQLLEEGFNVKVLDILFFGKEPINHFKDHPNFSLIEADFRKVDDLVSAMQDCSNVVHLGGLVGDPACAVDEFLTTEINLTSTKIIGLIAKAAGVKKFIFASSCSVYGDQNGFLNEDSVTKPLSLYAKTKIASERVLQDLVSEEFSPIILRFGTVFGLSGRTRFDLVVNLLSAKAIVEKNMTVFGANQNRPFIHVEDAAKSILLSLKAPIKDVHNQIFNIGSNDLNFNLLDVANLIKEQVPDSVITVEEKNEDARNYKVSFDKASSFLNFEHSWSLESGIEQVVNKFKSKEINDYSLINYSNVMHMSEEGKELLGALEYSGWEKDLLEAQI
jgi:nucleoside-diphosphate-sugar epimerase